MVKKIVIMETDKKSDSVATCEPKIKSSDDLASKPSTIIESNEDATNAIEGDENHDGQEMTYPENVGLDQERAKNEHNAQEPFNQEKSIAALPSAGNARSKCTVPRPFSLETEKRALVGNHACLAGEGGRANKLSRGDDLPWADLLRKFKSTSAVAVGKPLQRGNKMHQDANDSCSVASSYPSSLTAALRTSRGRKTVATAPTFICSERAQKRKDFHAKLEQKHQALAAEKMQTEARLREEQEAALKEFRRSLVVKANPMPSFYHEGLPPKVELKKAPSTRPKSPKFTPRKNLAKCQSN